MRDGVLFTPRAVIGQCEICGFEHAPYGTTENGKRLYWCRDHYPDRKAKGKAQ